MSIFADFWFWVKILVFKGQNLSKVWVLGQNSGFSGSKIAECLDFRSKFVKILVSQGQKLLNVWFWVNILAFKGQNLSKVSVLGQNSGVSGSKLAECLVFRAKCVKILAFKGQNLSKFSFSGWKIAKSLVFRSICLKKWGFCPNNNRLRAGNQYRGY